MNFEKFRDLQGFPSNLKNFFPATSCILNSSQYFHNVWEGREEVKVFCNVQKLPYSVNEVQRMKKKIASRDCRDGYLIKKFEEV